MVKINSGSVTGTINVKGFTHKIRDTEKFENESFGFPKKQSLPTDHFEFKLFQIVGAIGSGKTTLADRYYAHRIRQQWGKAVDFFKIEDLYAAVDGIARSRKPVHYCIMDDTVSKLDSRLPMKNIDMTELYFEIRHELRKSAKKIGGNAGGLVIMAVITQDYMAIDKRLRNSVMFTVFKTYDPICESIIPDPEVITLLRKLKDKSTRVCDYDYRKLGVGIDDEKKYTLFYADRKMLPTIPFEMIKGESFYKEQRNYLINYLIDNFELSELPKADLEAELFFKLDKIEDLGDRIRIKKSDLSEIIKRATRTQNLKMEPLRTEQLRELAKQKQENQKKERIKYTKHYNRILDHLINIFTLPNLTKDDLKAEILFEIEKIESSGEMCLVDKSIFSELIIKAMRIQKLQKIALEEEKRKSETNENEPNERTNVSVLILHDTFKKTFREIAKLKRISVSTAHDRYSKQKKLQENCLKALELNELELMEESINLNS